MIGETASHYRILERLGNGAMGEVFLAEDLRLHRSVALKMLHRGAEEDEEARGRLLREAQAASSLNHPNIAVIYEIDEVDRGDGPVRFIAMEYIAGETLAERSARGSLDLDGVLDVAGQIADALAEAHARGIVHRDVKPSNVMVTASGRVKILDFGLAQHQPLGGYDDATWTRDPAQRAGLVGTLAYMAPEQALGKDVDGRADVFSLGALLYELLAGRPPFEGRNAVQVLDALLHADPSPLPAPSDDPRLSRLEEVVRRMLAKERDHRPTTMRDVADELLALRAETASAGPRRPAPAASVAVLGFANITGNGEDDWLGTGIAETATADLRKLEGLQVVAGERVVEALRRHGLGQGEAAADAAAIRIGREVGVRWVVSGGFQRAGDAVRITARLTDVASGVVHHTVKIDGTLRDIFELQDRIVDELSVSLRPGVGHSGREEDETHVVEAYEAFSRGVINLRVESYESLDRAALLFERAVALDPRYARAHLELGGAYASKGDFLAFPELHERAVSRFRRVLELRPGMVRAWRALGSVLVSMGRQDEGEEAIAKALDLAPEDASALAAMGRALFIGRARFREAAEYFDRALARYPEGGWYALQLSHCAALLGEHERGEAAARRAAALQEASLSGQEGVVIVGSYMRLGHLSALQGRYAEAIEQLQRELGFLQRVDHALRGRIVVELNMRLGAAHLRSGHADVAAAALQTALDGFDQRIRLGADEPFTRYYAACAQALKGDRNTALGFLERAAGMRRSFTVERARIDPELEALRTEPRFLRLMAG